MTSAFVLSCLTAVASVATPMTTHTPPIKPYEVEIVGSWLGTSTVPGAELRLVFHITEAEDGTLTATMDSPDQSADGIPISEVMFAAGHLKLVSPVALQLMSHWILERFEP